MTEPLLQVNGLTRVFGGLVAANAARTTVNCLKWFEAVGPGPKPLSFPV